MGVYDAGPAFAPQLDPNNKYADYDVAGMQSLAPQPDVPSPDGAASQGALGAPSQGGDSSPAFTPDEGKGVGEARKPVSDFHRIYRESNDADRDAVADKMEEQFAGQGLSLQGAVNMVFEQGGETAAQLASEFGYLPPEESAGKEAFKTREQALSDYGVAIDSAKETQVAEKKKLDNRRAMGGFLMDVGLRIMASNKPGVGAIGEGVLGAKQARYDKGRERRKDTIAEEDRKRKIEREDAADEAARVEAAAKKEKREYDISQRGAEEKKRDIGNLKEVTNEEGEVYYFDPTDPKKGNWVTDKDGNRLKAADVGLSKAQIETSRRAYDRAVNSKVEKIKSLDKYERDKMYPETKGLQGKPLRDAIIEVANAELAAQSDEEIRDYETLDY